MTSSTQEGGFFGNNGKSPSPIPFNLYGDKSGGNAQ
jgi:hypothetical protein